MKTFSTKKTVAALMSLVMILSIVAASIVFQASAEDLPSGALPIHNIGYAFAVKVSLIAGDGETVAEIAERGGAEETDMNYAAVIVVDQYGYVAALYTGVGDDKSDVICPTGGYIISYNYNIAGSIDLFTKGGLDIKVGDKIKLYNVDPADARTLDGKQDLTDAGFEVLKITMDGYTHVVSGVNGTLQNKGPSGASFFYKMYIENGNLYFDFFVNQGLEFFELSPEASQTGASNFRIWLDANNNGTRDLLFDIFYNEDHFYAHRVVNAEGATLEKSDVIIEDLKSGDDWFSLTVGIPMSALARDGSNDLGFLLSYSGPFMKNGTAYEALHACVYDNAASSQNDMPWGVNGAVACYKDIKYNSLSEATKGDDDVPVLAAPSNSKIALDVKTPKFLVDEEAFDAVVTLKAIDIDGIMGISFELSYNPDVVAPSVTDINSFIDMLDVVNVSSSEWESLSTFESGKFSFVFVTGEVDNAVTKLDGLSITVPFTVLSGAKSGITYVWADNVSVVDIQTASEYDGLGSYSLIKVNADSDAIQPDAPVITPVTGPAFKVTLDAPENVKSGDTFEVVLSFEDFLSSIGAFELTFGFDEEVLDLIDASLTKSPANAAPYWEDIVSSGLRLSYGTASNDNLVSAKGELEVVLTFKALDNLPNDYIVYIWVDNVEGIDENVDSVIGEGSYIGIKSPITPVEESSEPPVEESSTAPVIPYPDNTPAEIDSKYSNVAQGRSYTASSPKYYDSGYNDGESEEVPYSKQKLTDGNLNGANGSDYAAAYNGGSATIILDLEETAHIKRFALDMAGNTSWGVSVGDSAEYFISDDGENWTSVGKISISGKTAYEVQKGEGLWTIYDFVLTLDNEVDARYVKIEAISPNYIWASELRVYGYYDVEEESSEPVEDSSEPIEDSSEPIEDSSVDDSSTTTITGDVGLIAFAFLAMVTLAGIVVVKKIR